MEEEDELPVDMVKDEEDDLSGLVLEEDPEMYEAAGIPYQPLFYFSQDSAGHTVRDYKSSFIAGS